MNKYLVDKAVAMVGAAAEKNDVNVWRETALVALEALADSDPYAMEKMYGL